jgi:hypothetical protein
MRNIKIIIIVFATVFISCSQQQKEEETIPEPVLIFQSGFEPESKVIPRGSDSDITGTDLSLNEKNDWVTDLDENPLVGNFNLQYQGGDSAQRFAKIVPEPGNPENHVLWFWLNEPNVGGSKGEFRPIFTAAKPV